MALGGIADTGGGVLALRENSALSLRYQREIPPPTTKTASTSENITARQDFMDGKLPDFRQGSQRKIRVRLAGRVWRAYWTA